MNNKTQVQADNVNSSCGGSTPPPWEWVLERGVCGIYASAGKAGRIKIAETYLCGPLDKANAHLITAAPELLAALKMTREWLLKPDVMRFLPQIESAIRKAEGNL